VWCLRLEHSIVLEHGTHACIYVVVVVVVVVGALKDMHT
jgi:hypothetical protein